MKESQRQSTQSTQNLKAVDFELVHLVVYYHSVHLNDNEASCTTWVFHLFTQVRTVFTHVDT